MAQLSSRVLLLALAGSALMFAGWVLAIVGSFDHVRRVALVVAVAVVGFGLVLIPAGLDIVGGQGQPGEKRGLIPLLVTVVPAAVLFVIVVFALPLGAVVRVLAIVLEAAGLVVSGRAWMAARRG